MAGAPIEALEHVPLFAGLNKRELKQVAALFKERRFAAGDVIVKEGTGGSAFYLIDSGTAAISIGSIEQGELTVGDHFGEIALIDEGTRLATITARTDSSAGASPCGNFSRSSRRTARSAGSSSSRWRGCCARREAARPTRASASPAGS